MFAVLLLALGAAIALVGVLTDGPHVATYHWRGPLFVSLSILSFAVTIRPLGLVVSAFASFLISALGTPETKWTETIIVGVCLTIGCSLLFPYALGLPLQQASSSWEQLWREPVSLSLSARPASWRASSLPTS